MAHGSAKQCQSEVMGPIAEVCLWGNCRLWFAESLPLQSRRASSKYASAWNARTFNELWPTLGYGGLRFWFQGALSLHPLRALRWWASKISDARGFGREASGSKGSKLLKILLVLKLLLRFFLYDYSYSYDY